MARHEASGVSGKRLQLSANRAKGLRRLPSGSWSALQTHGSRFVIPSLWTSAGKASGLERGLGDIRNQSMRDRHGGIHVPHVDVSISAFGRHPGHPSRMTKRPYAGIGPSKPCVAGIYPACRKTGRSFRPPAGIPYGSARSGDIGGRLGGCGASNGSRRQPSIDMPYSRIRSSCAFVKRLSPGKGSTAAG